MKVVIHYSEIFLKGKNRGFFENKLIENIRKSLKREGISFYSIKKEDSRLICSLNTKNKKEISKIQNCLSNVFGIKYFAFAEDSNLEMKEIIKKIKKILNKMKKENLKTISPSVKRSYKKFPLTSLELSKKIGEEAFKKNIKVDFSSENKFFLEITSKKAYFYRKKIEGPGGLPISSGGKILVLLSGGIDSALASWLFMKRGHRVDFLHFHVFKDNREVLKTKIRKIIEKLNKYQFKSRIFLAPYYPYELATLNKIQQRLELVAFKSFMLLVAQEIALKKKYKAIGTGDSLSQVASQTLDNIVATNYKIEIPVLRPLLCYDKQEIIDLSKKIGTYEESIKKYKDCCSVVSKKPSTSVKLSEIKYVFNKLKMKKLIRETLKKVEYFEIC
ncbi:MAG: tRNA 4-thiouridine(8) synthase ThiI [Candidatus Pacearchaeota archaeon]|nr:MAG: tRNA 4-thiouridine(8) synthase ThiI [Candidatus Pacearchaeota archaeon]